MMGYPVYFTFKEPVNRKKLEKEILTKIEEK
jgi:hypothetical protein